MSASDPTSKDQSSLVDELVETYLRGEKSAREALESFPPHRDSIGELLLRFLLPEDLYSRLRGAAQRYDWHDDERRITYRVRRGTESKSAA